MNAEYKRLWEELLDPAKAREKLIGVSVFIIAYELLKQSIVERIKYFFADGYIDGEPIPSSEYEYNVLSRNSSPVYASLNWLEEMEVINKLDIELFEKLKYTRNHIAHQLPKIALEGADFKQTELLNDLIRLLKKIEVWWIINFEIAANPDYIEQEIDEEEVLPGPVLTLYMMIDVLSGNDALLNHYRSIDMP